jgi:L-ascorbate metabolism protein UlaG (beta-lactamase superfamily)
MNSWGAFTSQFGNKTITRPLQPLPVDAVDIAKALPENQDGLKQDGLYVTWLGHSSLLIQIDGIRVLIDPVFSNSIGPVPWLPSFQPKRFQPAPICASELPFIDAVFISHNHYDHLDKKTVLELASKVGFFLTPLKVGKILRNWGIETAKVHEYGWWQEGMIQGVSGKNLHFACTPARHFSNRALSDRDKTLWASWTFWGDTHSVFYSGDTGYCVHFRQVGNRYGPFDLTIMENGQYGVNWPDIHLMPEEAVQAHLDLRGKKMLPIHWGSFNLAGHNWWEPIERVSSEALRLGVDLLTPRIGQTLKIDDNITASAWWQYLLPQNQSQLCSAP